MTVSSDFTEKENEAIEELRKRLKGDMEQELYDDKYLFLRFLKAQDFNINNAEAMLRKHLQWREEYDIKNILNYKKKEVLEKYVINILLGFDKEGCVIRYCPSGNVDFLGVIKSCTPEELIKCLIYEIETETYELKKESEKLGRNVSQCIYIYNYANLSFSTATSKDWLHKRNHAPFSLLAEMAEGEFSTEMLRIFLNNYPERLKGCYALNVSMYFTLMFNVVKPLLPKNMIDKIHLYSDDSYKEDLLKIIDADVLPGFLGGNRTDPDGNPLCLTFINHGGEPVPEKYFLQKGKHLLSKEPGVKKITLSRAAFHEEIIDVKEVGSYIEWEFETKCRDIGFGLFYNEVIDGQEKITELIPIQRIDTEEYPETGTYRCDRTGKYVIVFDNTYSWVRQKEIFIRAKVLTPEEHEAQLKD